MDQARSARQTIDWLETGPVGVSGLCPGCNSGAVEKLGEVDLKRLRPGLADDVPPVPVLRCRVCGTYTTISARNERFQGEAAEALAFHLGIEQRNRDGARHLLDKLGRYSPRPIRGILEIGCGPGFVLDEARKRGLAAIGYDIDAQAVDYGRRNFGLDLRDGLWSSDKNVGFDALLCISCLEHQEDPEPLVADIAEACRRQGDAVAVISVPLYPKGGIYPFCNDVKSNDASNIFRLVPWHVIHFTDRGFRALLARHGARGLVPIPRLWSGYLCLFDGASRRPGTTAAWQYISGRLFKSAFRRVTAPLRALKNFLKPREGGNV